MALQIAALENSVNDLIGKLSLRTSQLKQAQADKAAADAATLDALAKAAAAEASKVEAVAAVVAEKEAALAEAQAIIDALNAKAQKAGESEEGGGFTPSGN